MTSVSDEPLEWDSTPPPRSRATYQSVPGQLATIDRIEQFLVEKLGSVLSSEELAACQTEFRRYAQTSTQQEFNQPTYFSLWAAGNKKVFSVYVTPEGIIQLNVRTY
jgi:hypothetical protein